jgi:hypothetical protein
MARAVNRQLPTPAARIRSQASHVGFVTNKVTLELVSSELPLLIIIQSTALYLLITLSSTLYNLYTDSAVK